MADVFVNVKDRPITDALSVPGLLASSAIGGLGGFIYDRYIKKNKNIKSNLLKGLLFGGGSALAYGAYTLASESLRQHGNAKRRAEATLWYDHEEPDGTMKTRMTTGGFAPGEALARIFLPDENSGGAWRGAAQGAGAGYFIGSLLPNKMVITKKPYLVNRPGSRWAPRKTNIWGSIAGAGIGAWLSDKGSQEAIARGDLWGAVTGSAY